MGSRRAAANCSRSARDFDAAEKERKKASVLFGAADATVRESGGGLRLLHSFIRRCLAGRGSGMGRCRLVVRIGYSEMNKGVPVKPRDELIEKRERGLSFS